MRIFISAGEASGELYGALLVEALREELRERGQTSEPEFFGMGGDAMRRAGCDLVVDAHEIAVVGLAEVVEHLPRIYRLFRKVVREVERRRPDLAVLIDFPDFNFRLARQLHRRGTPVVYYVSPQLWAWRQSRIALVRKYVRKMLVIFPFEQKFYSKHGVKAEFVGHPLAEIERPSVSREQFAARYQLDSAKTWIALLPGSRQGEVSRIFPTLLKAAQLLGGDYVYIVPVASTLSEAWMRSIVRIGAGPHVVFTDDAQSTLAHCRVAVVASGTSTLQAALMGTPFAMVYRVSPLTWNLGRRLVKVDRFAMPNLIAEQEIVPELVQDDFTAERVASEIRRLLPDGADRQQMIQAFEEVRRRLQADSSNYNASRRAAGAILAELDMQRE
jgi:lipid-A-disaccharide synthase